MDYQPNGARGWALVTFVAALMLAMTSGAADLSQGSDKSLEGSPRDDSTCCRYVGDINHDGSAGGVPDIADVVYLVEYMFQDGPCDRMCEDAGLEDCMDWESHPNFPETDVNGDGTLIPDIEDLVYLINFMFAGGGPYPVGWIDYVTPACVK